MPENQVSDKVIDAVTEVVPKGVRAQITAFFDSELGHIASIALSILVVLLITALLKRIVAHTMHKLEARMRAQDNSSAALVGFVGHILVGLIYLGSGISIIGVLSSAIPLVADIMGKLLAAGGVLTVVAGLASQQALGSMVSGVMILIFHPFKLGDIVRYVDNDISGVVEEITLHHTTIRTWENKRVIVPNSQMNNAILENADYTDSKVCVFLDFNITYDSDIEKAKDLLAAQIQKHPSYFDYRTVDDRMNGAPPVVVRVVNLTDSAVVVRAWMWAQDNGTASVMKSEVLQGVKTAYEKAGVSFAYPRLSVVQK